MVGYHKNDTLTATQKLMAGCFSGCTTRFITQPLDVVKIRMQLQKSDNEKHSVLGLGKKIFREEGVKAFWHGHNIGQLHSILTTSSQFYVYDIATKYIMYHPLYNKNYKSLATFFCGTLAGCASTCLMIPLEVIRVRQMIVKKQYRSLFAGARAVYSTGGLLAFYEGLGASLLQVGPAIGIAFTVFSFGQNWILKRLTRKSHKDEYPRVDNMHNTQHLLIATSIAASLSGIISKTMTYPFDLAKRRLQIGVDGGWLKSNYDFLYWRWAHYQLCNVHRDISEMLKENGSPWPILPTSHIEHQKYTPSTSRNLMSCNRLLDCLAMTFKEEGLLGLFRGWKITMYKAQLTSLVAFTTYELTCHSIRDIVR